MTTQFDDAAALNDLITTLLDSVAGYEESAGELENQTLAEKFESRARERLSAVTQLKAAVAAAGGDPKENGSLSGTMHRAFVDLKGLVMGNDDRAIIAEIERGEDQLRDEFEKVLADTNLSPAGRAAAAKAWQTVCAGHDEMRALKLSLGA